MKFGKQLEENACDEWRDYYVQYKRLKRLIKRVAFEREAKARYYEKLNRNSSESSTNSIPTTPNSKEEHKKISLLPPKHIELKVFSEESPLLPTNTKPNLKSKESVHIPTAEEEFWNVLNDNLHVVNDFYMGKIQALRKSVNDFDSQVKEEQTTRGHVHSGPTRIVSDSGKNMAFCYANVQEMYDTLVDLKSYVQVNYSGFRKIVKKFDKSLKGSSLEDFMKKLEDQPFCHYNEVDHLLERIFRLSSRGKLEAGNMERRIQRLHGNDNTIFRKIKFIPCTISVLVFSIILAVPFLGHNHATEQRCLALLVFVTMLWVTEAIPYFAAALLVPPLVVFLRVLDDGNGQLLNAHKASKEVMSQLVNHTTVLIMGGYAISAAFSKCQIELYIAAYLQRKFKKRPNIFLLAIMLMGLFLSMWISNHTAPVLCISVLLPIIRDFRTDSTYAKTLLIGLAFACNLGGMMTPISSLQNTLTVYSLEKAGYSISFGQWMAMAVPFCTISTILCWAFLLWVMNPQDAAYIPQIVYDQKQKISTYHISVILLTLLTIFLWATFTITSMTFGDLGIISLMFMVIMFGSGMLTQFDFNSFSWHILFLIGGGNVLGEAVQRSGLLNSLSRILVDALPEGSLWFVTLCLCLIVLSLTTFVSHTVAAIILLPLIVELSIQIGNPHIPVICSGLAISAAMALPFSSFPNINSLLVLDDHGKPFLQVNDFLRVGIAFSLITIALISTLGYGLIIVVLGYDIPNSLNP